MTDTELANDMNKGQLSPSNSLTRILEDILRKQIRWKKRMKIKRTLCLYFSQE